MKPHHLRWLGLTAAAAAAVLCWHLLTMEPDATPRTAGKGPAPAALVTGKGAESSPSGPWPKFGTPEFKHTLHERGLKWLDLRGRDAEGLTALFDLTGDKALLAEAAEKFPDDPLVCMLMIRHAGEWKDRLPWVERLITAEPANPEGLYQKARALIGGEFLVITGGASVIAGDRAGALAALRQAASMSGPRNDHLGERMQTAREAALAMGGTAGDAVRLALDLLLPPRRTYASESMNREILFTELREAKASGSDERVMEIIGVGLRNAEKFFDGQQLTIMEEMDANQMKAVMMNSCPDNTPIGDGGPSLDVLRDEVTARRRYLAEFHHREEEAWAILRTASDDVMVAYFASYMANGEFEARKWLLSRPPKAN